MGITSRNISALGGQFIGYHKDTWSLDLDTGNFWNNFQYKPLCQPVLPGAIVEVKLDEYDKYLRFYADEKMICEIYESVFNESLTFYFGASI